jgi:hypothetical protein
MRKDEVIPAFIHPSASEELATAVPQLRDFELSTPPDRINNFPSITRTHPGSALTNRIID